MANERKTEKAIMKGKRQSQWFSFAKYTIFRYGLFKTRMVVTTPITDDCFWIAKTFFFSAKAAAGYERNDTITVDLEMTPVKNSPIRSKMHLQRLCIHLIRPRSHMTAVMTKKLDYPCLEQCQQQRLLIVRKYIVTHFGKSNRVKSNKNSSAFVTQMYKFEFAPPASSVTGFEINLLILSSFSVLLLCCFIIKALCQLKQ